MTELIFQAKPFVKMAAPTVRSIRGGFFKAIDSFAAERLRNAVPADTPDRAGPRPARTSEPGTRRRGSANASPEGGVTCAPSPNRTAFGACAHKRRRVGLQGPSVSPPREDRTRRGRR